jgi:hypothetical protein
MATVRQYFETDFSHVVRIQVKFALPDEGEIEALWLVDFLGYLSFLTCYVSGEGRPLDFYLRLIRALDYGRTQLIFQGKVGLPAARQFPGRLTIENKSPFRVCAQFFGDQGSISANDVQMSKRVFIYSETQLSEEEVAKLKEEGRRLGHEVQFRSQTHAMMRSRQDKFRAAGANRGARRRRRSELPLRGSHGPRQRLSRGRTIKERPGMVGCRADTGPTPV